MTSREETATRETSREEKELAARNSAADSQIEV